MASNIFSYNEEQSSLIHSRVTSTGQFLFTPSEESRTKEYERELKRQVALELHLITLAEYYKVKRIPRGLRVSLRPTLFSDNPEFCITFEQILNKCSYDLMTLTIDYLHKELNIISQQISTIEGQLTNTFSSSDLVTMKSKMESTISEYKKSLQERKRSKFMRDEGDYKRGQVYRWRCGESPARRRQPFRPDYSSSASSGSERDFPQTSFLGPRRGLPPKRRGGDRGDFQSGDRMTTRSQLR